MNELQELLLKATLIGTGATLAMDAWALLLKRLFGIPPLDYSLVGRWLGHMPKGTWAHPHIARAAPVAGERLLGWGAHYGIGIAFAALLLGLWGPGWADDPSLAPALLVGIGTLAAPFLLMQPCLGFGIAAAKAPNPSRARLLSLAAHSAFGLGLYLSALAWRALLAA
ncbi:DUF2938 domain-containing protein [Gallaecimonas sp. GXIMD4217]|uniref:DUF2938 domain-containing protein n=1 Tax=Gallaecimonas sp. GXIMD4217 TaxID=3131927 RepID=UPI00311AF32F